MADMTIQQIEYLLPTLNAIENSIKVLTGRIDQRRASEWRETEFALIAATAHGLADDCVSVATALSILRDVERGEV